MGLGNLTTMGAKFIAAAGLICLAACGGNGGNNVMPSPQYTDQNASNQTQTVDVGAEKLGWVCGWPGEGTHYTFTAANRTDIYDVHVTSRYSAEIIGIIKDTSVADAGAFIRTHATFDMRDAPYNPQNGSFGYLRFAGVPELTRPSIGGHIPSYNKLSNMYPYRTAALAALDMTFEHLARRPTMFCTEGGLGLAGTYLYGVGGSGGWRSGPQLQDLIR